MCCFYKNVEEFAGYGSFGPGLQQCSVVLHKSVHIREDIRRKKKTFLNGHCPFRGGVDPCPVGLVLFLLSDST